MAVLEDDGSLVMQAFVRRPLDDLPFLADEDGPSRFFDIANPYGYGGPLCIATNGREPDDLIDEFEDLFMRDCHARGYASEFSSLHPLLENHVLLERFHQLQLTRQKPVVYIPLADGEAGIWRGLNRGQKSSVNRARRAGVEIRRVVPDEANLETFKRLYYETMRRNGAHERWYFPADYFANCLAELGEDRVSFFFAEVGGEVAAAHMLLHGFAIAYYHFGGSDETFSDYRPSSLLIYEAALWASRQGYRQYHLGGGVSSAPDDSLFRFKAGFSEARAMLYTYGRVIDETTYRELSRCKRAFELRQLGCESDSAYFPLYRR